MPRRAGGNGRKRASRISTPRAQGPSSSTLLSFTHTIPHDVMDQKRVFPRATGKAWARSEGLHTARAALVWPLGAKEYAGRTFFIGTIITSRCLVAEKYE